MITIEPFRPEHVALIETYHSDGDAMQELLKQRPEYPQLLFHAGPAFSGFDEAGVYLGSFGMAKLWEGVGRLWLIADEKIMMHRKTFHRLFKSRMKLWDEMYRMKRMFTDVNAKDTRAVRWIESFGFVREGIQRSYGPTGGDYYLYARVIQWQQ